MVKKESLRKRYFILRKRKYFEVNKFFFYPLIKIIKKKFINKRINLSLYYPSSYEINILKILEIDLIIKQNILLPVVQGNREMNFFKWKKNDALSINKFGIIEPKKSKKLIPDLMLIPLLAFDKRKHRLGFGKGFYDSYLNKHLKKFKNIITVGVAFSFQKYHKLPISINDVKLNYILTEKGIF